MAGKVVPAILLIVTGVVSMSDVDPAHAAATPAVPTRTEAVTETLHGVRVADPYRWLEKAEDPEVVAWTAQQNAAMRKLLDAVPGRKALEERLWQLHEIGSLGVPVVKGKGKSRHYFYTRRTGKQNQPVLYVRKGDAFADPKNDRVLVDVNRLAADGTKALDWWWPSEDGRRVAYGVSSNGDENSVLHVVDVASGRDLADVIPRTRAASVAWQPDGKGFYYTRYPDPGSVPAGEESYHRHVYLHRLGSDPAADRKIFGAGRDLKDWPSVALSPNGRHLVVEVSQGWTKSEVFLIDTRAIERDAKQPPTPVTVVAGKNALFNVSEVLDDRFYVISNDGAPRYRLYAVDPAQPQQDAWKELIPEGADILQGMSIVGNNIATLYLKDASSRVRLFDRKGSPRGEIALPGLGSVGGLFGQHDGDELFYSYVSYLSPTIIFRHELDRKGGSKLAKGADPAAPATSKVWDKLTSPIDADAFEVKQERARSKDGTEVPMFLVHKKGLVRDGKNPTLLYGYGGFNISLSPGFTAWAAPFLEKGGVYVVANLRGGAEYGEAWHQAGMLGKKQNVFDDFIAVAEYLIAQKITSRDKLAISGRSNGGLLTSAALTQRPDLFRAAISGVPLTDMIRYHKFRIAQLWIPEYGSSEDPEAFKWLYAYSPYHRVKDGTAYPAVLLFTAESDTRVDALHARKMAARLQAASTSGKPVLLRLESRAGHGAGKPLAKVIEQATDELAFLFRELGI
ncbi:MAG TPA: prolyl oligopeptidase family serine peptidase [Polyangia bacterium]